MAIVYSEQRGCERVYSLLLMFSFYFAEFEFIMVLAVFRLLKESGLLPLDSFNAYRAVKLGLRFFDRLSEETACVT